MLFRVSLIVLLILSSAVNVYFIFSTLRKKLAAGGKAYSLLLLSVSIYLLGYALELSSSTLEGIFLAIRLEYLGIASFPVLWLLLAMRYSGILKVVRPRFIMFMFAVPLVFLALIWTNEYHHLYYRSLSLHPESPFPLVLLEKGPFYYGFVIFMYLCFFMGNIFFIRVYRESVESFRKQALVVVLISFIPWVSNIIYLAGIVPYNLDLGSLGLGIAGPLLGIAMARMKSFRITPIARRLIFQDMADPVMVITQEGYLADFNNAARAVFPFLDSESIGISLRKITGLPKDLISSAETGIKEDPWMLSLRREGKTLYYQVRKNIMDAPPHCRGGGIITLVDLTEEMELRQRLEHIASHDGLTGILNHRHFMTLAEHELSRASRYDTPISLIMLDLDYFKIVNDTLGHHAGDQVLISTAACLAGSLRSFDIFGRYGGEEFIILLPETDSTTAVSIAQRLRHNLEKNSISLNNRSVGVTGSFGVASAPPTERSLEALITAADRALYRAKAGGRNSVEAAQPPKAAPPPRS